MDLENESGWIDSVTKSRFSAKKFERIQSVEVPGLNVRSYAIFGYLEKSCF